MYESHCLAHIVEQGTCSSVTVGLVNDIRGCLDVCHMFVLFNADKEEQASDHPKVTLHHVGLSRTDMDTKMCRERKQLRRKRLKQISYLPREPWISGPNIAQQSLTKGTQGADVVSVSLKHGLLKVGEDLLQTECAAPLGMCSASHSPKRTQQRALARIRTDRGSFSGAVLPPPLPLPLPPPPPLLLMRLMS
ncbi:hypothetical protein Q8A73_006478 [Channa argus]|nr:hypothetical protein Q8A73_006478 [Channa argus]